MDAQNATADAKLIALSKAVAATNAQAANDTYQNNKIDNIAAKSDADSKATAQTRASDDKLIKTAQAYAASQAQAANDAYQNNKIAVSYTHLTLPTN